jgi:hypothetical protein
MGRSGFRGLTNPDMCWKPTPLVESASNVIREEIQWPQGKRIVWNSLVQEHWLMKEHIPASHSTTIFQIVPASHSPAMQNLSQLCTMNNSESRLRASLWSKLSQFPRSDLNQSISKHHPLESIHLSHVPTVLRLSRWPRFWKIEASRAIHSQFFGTLILHLVRRLNSPPSDVWSIRANSRTELPTGNAYRSRSEITISVKNLHGSAVCWLAWDCPQCVSRLTRDV